jgi:hypothetical protein
MTMMKACITILAALLACGTARGQGEGPVFSAGLKAWSTTWSGFTYEITPAGSVLTPIQAGNKLVWIPSASVRWGSLLASISAYAPADHQFESGTINRRKETDFNVAWLVTPGLALSAGYKRVAQIGEYRYRPAGPVIGASASAPLSGTLGLYGTLGLGRLKTPGQQSDNREVVFDADYQLAELGLSWALPIDRWADAINVTAGYRMQVLVSKDAGRDNQLGRDVRDLTQGFVFGMTMRF